MYTTYDMYQREVVDTAGRLLEQGIHIPPWEIPVPDFKPDYLVRVSDMTLVPGSSVNSHYWALSYSWNQSGKVSRDNEGEYRRIDQGKHKIVLHESKALLTNWWDGTEQKLDPKEKGVRNTTFEGLIQQMCIDFRIQYIWFDQMCCVNVDLRHGLDMHLIYKNAHSTLALVPEVHTYNNKNKGEKSQTANIEDLLKCQLTKRIWCMEELYFSKNVLFVGRDVHIWLANIAINHTSSSSALIHLIENTGNKMDQWRACTTLHYARTRTAHRPHDHIFALVNIFPETRKLIDEFDYKEPIVDLMQSFYTRLGEKDISILLFGAPLNSDVSDDGNIPTDKDNDAEDYDDSSDTDDPTYTEDDDITGSIEKKASLLPSWTGVKGLHVTQNYITNEFVWDLLKRKVIFSTMILESTFISGHISSADSVKSSTSDKQHSKCTKDGLPYQLTSNAEDIELSDDHLTFVPTTTDSQDAYNSYLAQYEWKATHFLPVKKKRGDIWTNTSLEPTHIGGVLSLVEECTNFLIVTGISVTLNHTWTAYPVVAEIEESYRSIGICIKHGYRFNFRLEKDAKKIAIR